MTTKQYDSVMNPKSKSIWHHVGTIIYTDDDIDSSDRHHYGRTAVDIKGKHIESQNVPDPDDDFDSIDEDMVLVVTSDNCQGDDSSMEIADVSGFWNEYIKTITENSISLNGASLSSVPSCKDMLLNT